MEIKLPKTGDIVTLLDFYSQGAHECFYEALSERNEKIVGQPITNDDILETLGIEYFEKMNGSEELERDEMRRLAEVRIRNIRMSSNMSVRDFHYAEKAKISALVLTVNGKEVQSKMIYLSNLPVSEFKILSEYVKKLQEESESEKKR